MTAHTELMPALLSVYVHCIHCTATLKQKPGSPQSLSAQLSTKWPFSSKRGTSPQQAQSVELATTSGSDTVLAPLSNIPQLLQGLGVPGMLTDMLSGKSASLQGDTLGALTGLFQDPCVAAAAARDGVIQVSSCCL
jgi:hypothetical protein